MAVLPKAPRRNANCHNGITSRRRVIAAAALVLTSMIAGAGMANATPQSSSPVLVVSTNAERTDARALAGATVNGNIYVYVDRELAKRVDFYLDTSKTGIPYASENAYPFDFAGTDIDGAANAFDTRKLSDGNHKLIVVVRKGAGYEKAYGATFTVQNGSASQATTTTTAPPVTVAPKPGGGSTKLGPPATIIGPMPTPISTL